MEMQDQLPEIGMIPVQQVAVEEHVEEIKIDFLQIARDAEASSTSWFDTNVRVNMQQSLNQFNARHDPASSYHNPFFKSRSKLYLPKTRANIRKHEAIAAQAYFSTQDVLSIDAFNQGDKNELAAADFYKELLNLRLTSSGPLSIQWFQNLMGSYQDAMVYGVSISYQFWNSALNKPDLTLIEPENFRFDPACDWVDPINSSPFLIWKIPMRVGEIKEKMRRGDFEKVSDEQLARARRPETNSVSQARQGGRTDPIQRSNAVREFDIVWVNLNIVRQVGIDWGFYTLGSGDAFLTIPVPIEEMWAHGERPFVMGKAIIESHKNYPSSLPQLTKDIQSYLNRLANQRLDNAMLAMDKRYFVRAGARVETDSIIRNAPGSITMVGDVEKDVKIVNTPDINPSAYKEQSLFEIAMDDISGGFNSSTMQSNRSLNETVGGMSMISQSANQVSGYQLKVFNETWVEPALRQLLKLSQHYESDEVIINLAANNAQLVRKYQQVSFSDIRLKDLMLTVQVGMDATNPATRLEKFTMAIQALANAGPVAQQMGMNMQEVVKEVFGALGFKDGDRFFEEGADPEKVALQQQVQQLQQELANKRNPELDAAQTELTKAQAYKVRSEASFANIQAAQVIAAMPAVAPVADKVAETNGFVDMNGGNPEYEEGLPSGMSASLQSIGMQDPDALAAANEQARMFKIKGSTDPILPATGVQGAMNGIKGGQE